MGYVGNYIINQENTYKMPLEKFQEVICTKSSELMQKNWWTRI